MNTPVKFKLAKLLKEKGFDKPVRTYRLEGEDSDLVHESFEDDYWGNNRIVNWSIKPFRGFVSAPTIAEVVMWLYEKHGIWVSVKTIKWNYEHNTIRFNYNICKFNHNNSSDITDVVYDFNSPTKAYEAAIEYTLNNLI